MKITSSHAMPLEGRRFFGTTPRATTFTVMSIRNSAVAIHPAMAATLALMGTQLLTQCG